MSSNRKRGVAVMAGVASGVALLLGTGLSQPAAAAGFPPVPGASFYTQAGYTGTEMPVDLGRTGCVNLPEEALSGANLSAQDIEVYYNADCKTGAPGEDGDLYFALVSLHTVDFGRYPAVSYRVLPQ